MGKDSWDHIFLFFHMVGIGLILSLPISAHMIKGSMANPKFPLRAKARIAVFLSHMDEIAKYGAIVLIATGIGLMWSRDIPVNRLWGTDWKLGVVLLLFAIIVVNGNVFAGRAIKQGRAVLEKAAATGERPSPEMLAQVQKARQFISITGAPQIGILALTVLVAAFAANP
jgi:hypothetical protein